MPNEEVREAAEGLAASLERNHGVRARWEGDTVHIVGAGVDGRMSFHDEMIDVSVKLGLLYGGIELLLGFSRTMPGIAHFAHLGGMLFGALLLYRWGWRPGMTWRR